MSNGQSYGNKEFDNIANDYKNWEIRGKDLKYASYILDEKANEMNALFKQFKETGIVNDDILKMAGLPMISLMLKGYTIEVFAKAIFIKKYHKVVAKDGNCSFSLKGANNHDLNLMLEDVGILLDESEKSVIRKLFLIVTSFGRYPTTKKSCQAPLKDQGYGIPGRLLWQEEDDKLLKSLINRLENELNQ